MNEKPQTQPTQEPDSVLLPLALMNDILTYMNEKPHKEVSNMIAAVQTNAKLVVTKEPEMEVLPKTEVDEVVEVEEVEA